MSRQREAEQTTVVCQGLGCERAVAGGDVDRQVKCSSSSRKDLDFAARWWDGTKL